MHVPPASSVFKLMFLTLFCGGCSSAMLGRNPVASATVALVAPNGSAVGTAQLRQAASGAVTVDVTASSLAPGAHGIHFHAVGRCEGATEFSTAGAHYNPLNREHGLERAGGPHAGDAPNLEAGADGRASLSFTTDRVTLASGATSLFDADGSALVVHGAADDQVSQPAGNSGARVACGVVRSAG